MQRRNFWASWMTSKVRNAHNLLSKRASLEEPWCKSTDIDSSPEKLRKGQSFIPGERSNEIPIQSQHAMCPKNKARCAFSSLSLCRPPQAWPYNYCICSSWLRNITNFPSLLSLTFHILSFSVWQCLCFNISAVWCCGTGIKHSTSRIIFPIYCLLGQGFILQTSCPSAVASKWYPGLKIWILLGGGGDHERKWFWFWNSDKGLVVVFE